MKIRTLLLLALALLAATAAQARQVLQATIVNMNAHPRTSPITVMIDRTSTDAERAHWREVFAKGGQEALVKAWQDEKPVVGHFNIGGRLGQDIRAALVVQQDDGKKRYILATDRQISGFEVMRNSRSEDYPIGWLQMEIGPDGKGEGFIVGMAAFTVEDGKLVMTTYGTQPSKLLNVSVREDDK